MSRRADGTFPWSDAGSSCVRRGLPAFVFCSLAAALIMPVHAAPMPSVSLPLDERQGAVAKDRAGHSLIGLLRGGAAWVPGIQGSAVSLDPKQRQFVALNRAAVNTAASFTVSAWVKVNRLEGGQTFISQDGETVSRFCLGKRGDDNRFVFSVFSTDTLSATVQTAVSAFVPTPGLWYHLTGVYDWAAGQARLYVDGGPLTAVPTAIAMSRSLADPWHLDPRWRVFPGGHQALFTGPDGRFWTAYKHERTSTVPWLSVDPIDFDLDGNVQVTLTTGPQSITLTH